LADKEPLLEAMARVVTHLPEGEDLQLLILKGHLLAEEQLFYLLRGLARDPQPLEEANLRFRHAALLCAAFVRDDSDRWVWQRLLELNKLRNAMAHQLEPDSFSGRVLEFVTGVESAIGFGAPDDTASLASRLRRCLAMIVGSLHDLR
jgi:hypothetical protein